MMRAMYAAISGLKTHQTMLDVTANNLANVNTVGYKSSRAEFKDTLNQVVRSGAAPNASGGYAGSNSAQIGLGVAVSSIDNLMGNGAIQQTNQPLDVSISGEGWFRVAQNSAVTPTAGANPTTGNSWTTMNYTRAGNFTRNSSGYLTTQDGYYVVGQTAAGGSSAATDCYINVPLGASDVTVSPDGAVSFIPPATGYTHPSPPLPAPANGRAIAGYLALAKFPNQDGLERVSGNRWRTNGAAGAEAINTPGNGNFGGVNGGSVEMSNVDLATEFTNMITAQRGFQANSRVLSTGDQMLQELVNLNH